MNDWVDEILEDIEHARGGDASNTEEHPGERMARVIRELVDNIKLEKELPMSYATEEAAEESWNAALALSPDAKELLK